MVNPNGSPDRKAENAEQRYADALKNMTNEQLSETLETLKKRNANQKRGSLVKKAMLIALTTAAAAGIVGNKTGTRNEATNAREDTQDITDGNIATAEVEDGAEVEEDIEVLTGNEKLDALIDGSFEQYDNVGLYKYEMDKKWSDNAVSNPKAILEYMGVDPAKATAEDYGTAYEYVVYSQKESAAFVAVANKMEGFENLSYEQGEKKIADMSAEEKDEFQEQLKDHFDDVEYEFETGKGMGTNHFIREKEDGSTYGVWIIDDETGIEHVNAKHKETNGYTITYMQARCFNVGDKVIIQYADGTREEIPIKIETPPEETPGPTITPGPEKTPGPTITPGPEKTPEPTPETTPEPTPEYDDSKNSEAIWQNMQTHEETNNYVAPTGPGEVEARPDTSTNSYEVEQQYQIDTTEQAWSAPSESANYETVGEVIANADQTSLADHTNYTPEQEAEKAVEQQNQNIEAEANNAEIVDDPTHDEEAAADWFNNLTNGGGQ